jgi:hypothetical protein
LAVLLHRRLYPLAGSVLACADQVEVGEMPEQAWYLDSFNQHRDDPPAPTERVGGQSSVQFRQTVFGREIGR